MMTSTCVLLEGCGVLLGQSVSGPRKANRNNGKQSSVRGTSELSPVKTYFL